MFAFLAWANIYIHTVTMIHSSILHTKINDRWSSLFNPLPDLIWYTRLGSGMLQLSPLRVPGTDLKVGTECKGHGEVKPEPLAVGATRYSHQITPPFTPPIQRLHRSLGAASLVMGADVRVLPRLLESEDSESALLGRYHSGIDRDSSLNRLSNDPRKRMNLFRGAHR